MSEPRRSAADLAGAALLGALLWDPRRLVDVSAWLEPDDFGNRAHTAIYATLVGLARDGVPVDLTTFPALLAQGRYHGLHVFRDGSGPMSANAVHDLIALTPATPRTPDQTDRSQHVRYAQLVLDDAIRRQVTQAGSRIDQNVRHVAEQRSDEVADTLAPVLADVAAQLDHLTTRLQAGADTSSPLRAALTPRGSGINPGPAPGPPDIDPAPQHRARRPSTSTSNPLRSAEADLIGVCLSSDPVCAMATERLTVADFAVPALAATWHAMVALQDRGEPVDMVLVAAEVERQGGLPGIGAGLPADHLAALHTRSHVGYAYGLAALETVAHASLVRAVQHAHTQLVALGGDRTQSGAQIVRAAQLALRTADAASARLTNRPAARAGIAEQLNVIPLPPRGRPTEPPAARTPEHRPPRPPRATVAAPSARR